jgi:large subunit ribosomal protein L15
MIKVLGNGDVNGAVTVQAHSFSKSAEDKIKKAGGKTEVINV